MGYNDCDGIFNTTNYTTSGYQYRTNVCVTGSTDLVFFRYYENDVLVNTSLSTLNTSIYCCGSIPPTPTPTPTNTPTETPTNTPTPTITETPTNTPTVTPTNVDCNCYTYSFQVVVPGTVCWQECGGELICFIFNSGIEVYDSPCVQGSLGGTATISIITQTICDNWCVPFSQTPTPTPTETPTPTVTETPTNTPTPTVTETPTNTPTPTVTETPTNTPMVTPTNTSTVTPTVTTTNTPTVTPTPTTTSPPLVLCETYSVTISSGSGNVGWTNCNGSSGFGTVTPEEPLGFCAQVGTVSSSATVNITPGSPCTSPPEGGCYSVTFNPGGDCPTNLGNVEISYAECNGNQVISQPISALEPFTTCALVGGAGLQPGFACGVGTISIGSPCIQLGLISSISDGSNACPLSMGVNCWISGIGEPNQGDVIYTDAAMTTVFNGDGGYYHFTIQSSTFSYSAIVNSFGVIESIGFLVCV
jgi:hypothetical protein